MGAPRGCEGDDAELVAAALGGDKGAFVVLIGRHRAVALGVTARFLCDGDLAADAVQEATVVALVSLDRLHSQDRFGAWFCGIALNVARRWLRVNRPLVALDDVDGYAGALGPDEAAEVADTNRLVRRAVKGLAAGQRQAVLLFYWQGLGHADAAAELGISVGAVKSRLHQARRSLRPSLAAVAEPVEVSSMPDRRSSRPVEVVVAEVRRGVEEETGHRGHVVVLAERHGGRQLPIWIGRPEAAALALSLEAREMPRPMTYQLAANLLAAGGARITEVRITRLEGNIFYAVVAVEGPGGVTEVDARPSDGLNMALVAGVPVFVDDDLFDEPSILSHTAWRDYPRQDFHDLVVEMHQFDEQQLSTPIRQRADDPPDTT
jgi:hypothetical protein